MGLFDKKKTASGMGPDEMVTVVGAEAHLQGVLNAKGSLRVDGRIEGSVSEGQTVVVGPGGEVKGDISAEHVVVGGRVAGNITASGQLEILASGRVQGDVKTPRLTVEDGAVLNGRCAMEGAKK